MLPKRLLERLRSAPRWIVAPVGVGFGQAELRRWAEREGRVVLTDPADLHAATPGGAGALLVPRRRRDLLALPSGWVPEEVLLLSEHDLTLSRADWDEALAQTGAAFREASWDAARGWPEGLRLARLVAPAVDEDGPEAPDLARHPLVTAHVERLVPTDLPRDVVVRAAATPLLLDPVRDVLGLTRDDVAALSDAGLLYADAGGERMTPLLRAVLAVHAHVPTDDVAHALVGVGRTEDALTLLAHAGRWPQYLGVLSGWFKASMGEEALRSKLARIPPVWSDRPERQYLGGLLERIKGEFVRAESCYAAALRSADESLAPTVHNARGVTLAMLGRDEEALAAFEQATRGGSALTSGEAWHNRAGILLQLQRYTEAEASLREAISAFRASGDFVREARTLHLLGTFYARRGLLAEAERTYREALTLQTGVGGRTPGEVGSAAALVRVNFAEVLCLLGEVERAERELELATREADDSPGGRTWAWTRLNAALLRVVRGDLGGAEMLLGGVLLAGPRERSLRAEAHLLLGRVRRLRGESGAAREALREAEVLGLRSQLEDALVTGEGLDEVIARARHEEARYELAVALLHSGGEADLREALGLIRTHRYRTLLQSPLYASRLVGLGEHDADLRELFPVELKVMGGFEVRFLGRTLTLADFPTRKSAAVLVALALTERPVPRDLLAERFWPGAKNPAGSLQTAIYHLRAALGATVVRGERGLLSLAFPVHTDLTRLQEAVTHASALPPREHFTALRDALASAGDFLTEFPEDFDEERAEAEARVLRWRRSLVTLSAEGSEERLGALRAVVASDPYDLAARRELVTLHEARGDAEGAALERRRLTEVERELLG